MLIESFEKYFLSVYRDRESEAFFQARVLLIIHMFLIILMLVILALGFSDSGMIPFLSGIIILSIISLVFLRYGKLTTVTLITYIATGLFASLIVFNRLSYNIYETYMLATIHMSITVVASLLTNQRRYTLVTTGLGVIYIILLYFFRGIPLSSSTHPLEIDDYLVAIGLLILTGLIITKTVTRQKELLEIAETESAQNIAKAEQIKQSEENLKHSYSLLNATLDSIAEGILVVSANGTITNLNKKFIELWRIPESVIASHDDEKAISFVLDQLIDPDGFLKKVKELYLKDEQTSFDVLDFKDGRTFERYSQPQIIDGESVGRVWSFRDITERKRANEKIERHTKQQERLLEMGRQVTSALDIETVLKHVSDKVRILLGAQGVTIYMLKNQGKTLSPVLSYDPPFDKEVMAAKIDVSSSLTGKAIKAKKGLIFNDADKQAGRYHVPGTPLDDDHLMIAPIIIDGKAIGSLNVYRKAEPFTDEDLSLVETFTLYASTAINNAQVHRDLLAQIALKQAEGDLYRSEERYQTLVESLKEGIGRVDENETFTLVNQAAADMFGYSKDEMIGKNLRELVSPEAYDQIIEQTAKRKEGASSKYELEIEREEGINRSIEVSATPISSEKGEFLGTFAIFHDITERKQAEQERLSMEEQLHQSQKLEAVGTMVGGISHEFNNILQGIFLYGDILKDQLQENENAKTSLKAIMDGSKRGAKIVSQIMVFMNQSETTVEAHDLKLILQEAIDLQRAITPSQIEIVEDYAEDCKRVRCDPTQMHQIVVNLCNNAQDAMPKGGILNIRLKQIISNHRAAEDVESHDQTQLEVKISDTGRGMTDEVLTKIFDPFFTTKEVGEGTGLGLSVVHGLIEQIGGSISVISKLGEGSSFRILLPTVDD